MYCEIQGDENHERLRIKVSKRPFLQQRITEESLEEKLYEEYFVDYQSFMRLDSILEAFSGNIKVKPS